MHARSAKTTLQAEGIDDWPAIYDHRLEPTEHVSLADANRESIQGDRLDEVRHRRGGGRADRRGRTSRGRASAPGSRSLR
ncbi:hypothetical protein [Natrarchaeobius chitinivorans]|uniref:hypothetical protein n=1 Tax=Natrarchaeobius chitinivorans TaxID=1679083 RepID=UPI001FB48F84|nr:hypothetical protein [Natrarchaeobius chitinivorans]